MRKWIVSGLVLASLATALVAFASTGALVAAVVPLAGSHAATESDAPMADVRAVDDVEAPALCSVEPSNQPASELFGLGGGEPMMCRQISPGCFYAFNPDTLCCEEITGNLCPTAPCLY